MSGRQNGGPAFPCKVPSHPAECGSNKMVYVDMPGMTLRDWFAGMALQGFLSSPQNLHGLSDKTQMGLCRSMYAIAKDMLNAREETA